MPITSVVSSRARDALRALRTYSIRYLRLNPDRESGPLRRSSAGPDMSFPGWRQASLLSPSIDPARRTPWALEGRVSDGGIGRDYDGGRGVSRRALNSAPRRSRTGAHPGMDA